jgi:hypothetical protein
MADFQVPDKDLETNIDRSADSFLIYDNSAAKLVRTNINSALNVTSQPVGEDDIQTLTNKTLTSPTITGIGSLELGSMSVDTISEKTAANGVEIDGFKIVDGLVVGGAGTGVNNASLDTTAGELGGAFLAWTPTLGGWSVNPTDGLYYYTKVGKMYTVTIAQPNNGTSNNTTCTFTLPAAAVTRAGVRWVASAEIIDNGSSVSTPGIGLITSGSSTLIVSKSFSISPFTASGDKRVRALTITYEAA